jgi:pyruvate kinase
VDFTKIIATIGPASIEKERLDKMVEAGMNCVRINTAHGNFEQYETIIDRVRDCGGVATMVDIKGPELRIRLSEPLELKEGESFLLSFSEELLPRLNYDIYDDLVVGDTIYFDEGFVETTVVERRDDHKVRLEATHDATIKPDKGVNTPGKELSLPSISEKDEACLRFVKKHDVDYVAQSFVRRKEDVEATRDRLGSASTKIIAKIENHEGVDNLDEIIEASDGVMIARGDLGVELPQERIPAIQKAIVRKTTDASGMSIVATQMLESMTNKPKPTRAEVSDVANAVLDGADAVMLSGETAIGSYPVEAVRTMRNVASEIETDIPTRVNLSEGDSLSEQMSAAAYTVSQQPSIDCLIVIGEGTRQTRLLSRYRLCKPVISVTDEPRVARQLNLVWGSTPVRMDALPQTHIIPQIARRVYDEGLVDRDDTAVFFAGVGTDDHEEGNLVEAHRIGEFLDYHDLG